MQTWEVDLYSVRRRAWDRCLPKYHETWCDISRFSCHRSALPAQSCHSCVGRMPETLAWNSCFNPYKVSTVSIKYSLFPTYDLTVSEPESSILSGATSSQSWKKLPNRAFKSSRETRTSTIALNNLYCPLITKFEGHISVLTVPTPTRSSNMLRGTGY